MTAGSMTGRLPAAFSSENRDINQDVIYSCLWLSILFPMFLLFKNYRTIVKCVVKICEIKRNTRFYTYIKIFYKETMINKQSGH